jgi:predicted ATPase/DNA-binding winged helix-turn-helix (wHTH) protein
MTQPAGSALRFGPYCLDAAEARLTRDGAPIELPPKAFELLCFLASRPGRLVTKDELLDQVWGRRFITEAVIKTVVSELRAALGDDAREPRYVETVPRRGYRFIATPQAADAAAASLPAAGDEPGPGSLPAFTTPPIGRDAELAALDALLATHRLVTLVGPAGVGKTTLALAAARVRRAAHADGAWLVDLAPVPAGEAGAAVLRSTLMQALRLNAAAAADDASLARAVAPMRALVLLDNAEHLLDPLARLVGAMREGAASLQLLVTSQEPLQVAGEQLLRLAPLGLPARPEEGDPAALLAHGALRLFVERTAARLPGFVLTPLQVRAAHEVCRLLDGMPLALELAAARVPLLGVHGLLERLSADDAPALDALGRGRRDAPPRHRSLRDALTWSHDLLTPRERAVFRRLAVFRGGFVPAVAQAVAGDADDDEEEVLDLIGALVDKSLVVAQPGLDAPRLTLLEAPRALALERLDASGEGEVVRERHACALLQHLQRLVPLALSLPTFAWHEQVLPELPNLRAALAWAHAASAPAELQVGLVAWGVPLWHAAGASAEAVQAIDAVDPLLSEPLPAATRARFHLGIAQLAAGVTLPAARGYPAAVEAAAQSRRVGNADDELWALSFLVPLAAWTRQAGFDRGAALVRMGELASGADPLRGRPLRMTLGAELMRQGDWAGFRDAMRREVDLLNAAGDQRGAWLAASNLCTALLLLREVDEAARLMGAAAAAVRAAGRARQVWQVMLMNSICLIQQGQRETAEAAFEESFALQQAAGARWQGLEHWSWLLALRGNLDAAARLQGWSDAMGERLQMVRGPLSAQTRDLMAERLRTALGDGPLQALAVEGRTLNDDDVLALLRRR